MGKGKKNKMVSRNAHKNEVNDSSPGSENNEGHEMHKNHHEKKLGEPKVGKGQNLVWITG
jgi:hypothetical protein